jgi:hypothetical protein
VYFRILDLSDDFIRFVVRWTEEDPTFGRSAPLDKQEFLVNKKPYEEPSD